MLKRKVVGIGIAVVIVFVLGVTQLQAQSTLTLEGLSSRITSLAQRVTALSSKKADRSTVRTLEARVSALEAELEASRPTSTPTRRRPTATATRPRPTPTRVRPTATPTPAKAYITITRNMNVRSGPNTTYEVVGYATVGQEFDITGRNVDGSWWRIEFEGENAWIYAPYVTAVNARGIRTVPTPVPPTATPLPPTATPAPESNMTQEMDVGEAVYSVMLSDYQNNESAFDVLTQSQREHLAKGYILLFEYVTNYCGLSYENMAQLLHHYAGDLDKIRFTAEDGTKPRAFLMAFAYGFTRDSEPGAYSCNTVLDLGQAAALSS